MLSRPALAIALIGLTSCSRPPAAALDPQLASAIPPGATAIAGADLPRLRSSPYFTRLQAFLNATPALQQAPAALFAWNGSQYAIATRDTITGPLAPAATLQRRTGKPGEPSLAEWAEQVANGHAAWAVLTGGRNLRLTGNAANLNRLLRGTQYATLTLDTADGLSIAVRGHCEAEADAEKLEQTVRAMITIGVATTKSPETQETLRAIALTREGTNVMISLRLPPQRASALVDYLLPSLQ